MKIIIISAALALAPVCAGAQETARQGDGVLKAAKRHQVADGDTLWDLAAKYYADPFKWGTIYNANLPLVSDPDLILPKWELVIPGLTEEVRAVKPALPAGAEKVAEMPAPADESGEDTEFASAHPEPAAAPAAPRVPASQGLGTGQKLPDLSEEMPEDQKEWGSFLQTRLAGPDWRDDGRITGVSKDDGDEDGLSFTGETVAVRMRSGVLCKAGDYLEAYKVGSTVSRDGKVIGTEIQRVALLEVISSGDRDLKARVLDANSSVYKGLSVKKK